MLYWQSKTTRRKPYTFGKSCVVCYYVGLQVVRYFSSTVSHKFPDFTLYSQLHLSLLHSVPVRLPRNGLLASSSIHTNIIHVWVHKYIHVCFRWCVRRRAQAAITRPCVAAVIAVPSDRVPFWRSTDMSRIYVYKHKHTHTHTHVSPYTRIYVYVCVYKHSGLVYTTLARRHLRDSFHPSAMGFCNRQRTLYAADKSDSCRRFIGLLRRGNRFFRPTLRPRRCPKTISEAKTTNNRTRANKDAGKRVLYSTPYYTQY